MKRLYWIGAAVGAALPALAAPPALAQTINFLGAQNGSYSYVAMYAASAILNKSGDGKIKGVVEETFGASDNLKRLDQNPELRKHAFAATTTPAQYSAIAGTPKDMFPTPIKGMLQVFNTADFCAWIAVGDQNIKTVEGLAGKTFDAGPYGNFLGSIGDSILQSYGVKDKMKLLHTADQAAQYDSFGDGKVDGILAGGVMQGEGVVAYNASAKKLLASRTVWPVSISPDKVKDIAKLSGIPFASCAIKAGQPNPNAPAYTSLTYAGNVVAHADMDPELVYQVMKVLIAHVNEFGDYADQAKKAMLKDTIAAINVPVSEFHPGAVKAYREAGIKIGEENFK